MPQYKSTMVELVTELEEITPRTELIAKTIALAKQGEFHDYKNQMFVCGKVALIDFLRRAGLMDLRKRVIDGEFDEQADADDIAMMRKEILENTKDPKQAEGLIDLFKLR